MDLYAENILEHFKNPHHFGELKDPSVSESESNPLCGDKYVMDLAIDDEGVIRDVAFKGEGCAISKAAVSMLADILIGMTVHDAAAVDKNKIYELLGTEVSAGRAKCALLGLELLKKSLKKYSGERKKSDQ